MKGVLHGPKGEKRGVPLEDGQIVRIHPHAAEALNDKLAPGHKLAARGEGLTNALGTVNCELGFIRNFWFVSRDNR